MNADDDDETEECAQCHTRVPLEDLSHYGEDFDLCPECSVRLLVSFESCAHVWDPEPTCHEWGDAGQACLRCGIFLTPDSALSWAPLICDGYVEVPIG